MPAPSIPFNPLDRNICRLKKPDSDQLGVGQSVDNVCLRMNTLVENQATPVPIPKPTPVIRIAKCLEIFVTEMFSFIFLFFALGLILPSIFAPLISMLSNGKFDGQVIGGVLSWMFGLVAYGFWIGFRNRSDQFSRHLHFAFQWSIWAAALLFIIGRWSIARSLLPIAGVGLLLLLGMEIAKRLSKPDTSENESHQNQRLTVKTLVSMVAKAFALSFCFFGAAALGMFLEDKEQSNLVGKVAPDATFVSAADEEWSLSAQRGKVVWLQFYGNRNFANDQILKQSCNYTNEIQAKLADNPNVVFVNVWCGKQDRVSDLNIAQENTVLFPLNDTETLPRHSSMRPNDLAYLDRFSIYAKTDSNGFQPRRLPTTYVIDRNGKIHFARASSSRFDSMPPNDAVEMIQKLVDTPANITKVNE